MLTWYRSADNLSSQFWINHNRDVQYQRSTDVNGALFFVLAHGRTYGRKRTYGQSRENQKNWDRWVTNFLRYGAPLVCLRYAGAPLLMRVINKHAPLKTKRIWNNNSPRIENELLREIYKRDFLKKKAAFTNDPLIWKQFKDARN